MKKYRVLVVVLLVAPALVHADELTFDQVASSKGDGPDGKGNTADDTWQFWFELAHERGRFQRFDTHSASVPKKGVTRKITGPIASLLPNPEDTEGWIFHRDWDGRFEGVWGDKKTKAVLAYPYVEKKAHCAVAITYRVKEDGRYDISATLTDLQVEPKFPQHDGIDWIVDIADDGRRVGKAGSGGPIGDGHDRPDSGSLSFKNVEAKKGQLLRLIIHPRAWWGTDLTRIDGLRIEKANAK